MQSDIQSIYGLIGYPLGHSFSRDFFNNKFESERIDAAYVNFEMPDISEFPALVAATPNISGLNVTIPYKEKVIPYLDELDEGAAKIGAVNVIRVIRDARGQLSRLKGYNSDIIGFTDSIGSLIKPCHKRALVLGTGGAAKAIWHGLVDMGIEPLYVSRTPGEGKITYSDLDSHIMDEHKVIVNTTPLGMYPHIGECPDIPYDLLTPDHLCYDLLYNPDVTLFMRKAAEHGATVKNGLEMLLMQAFAAWNIWNLKKP